MKESDLYAPLRDFFTDLGYDVKGEVNHCDITAVRDEDVVIVEQKLTLNLDVILQAVDRQKISELVYIAVPYNDRKMNNKRWKEILHLLRRLELGLLSVKFFESGEALVECHVDPAPFDVQRSIAKSKRRKKKLLTEFNNRHGDYNQGGMSKRPIITAYREKALFIAYLLRNGQMSTRDLRKAGADKDMTLAILYKNHYDWFIHIDKGVYDLNEKGKEALCLYNDVIEKLKNNGTINP